MKEACIHGKLQSQPQQTAQPQQTWKQRLRQKAAKKSTGRKPREAKEHLVSDTIAVFPPDVDRDKCIHHRFQSAWRIVDGKAVYLRYDIRDLPGSTRLPLPPGIRNSRCDEKVITAKAAAKQVPPVEPTLSHVATFILLQQELVDHVDCLFVCIEHPEVEPTNNRSERNARREAEIRKGAGTNKTNSGADRRSVIVTFLASLQTRIAKFTLSNMLAEVSRWVDAGKSLFEMELEEIQAKRAPPI